MPAFYGAGVAKQEVHFLDFLSPRGSGLELVTREIVTRSEREKWRRNCSFFILTPYLVLPLDYWHSRFPHTSGPAPEAEGTAWWSLLHRCPGLYEIDSIEQVFILCRSRHSASLTPTLTNTSGSEINSGAQQHWRTQVHSCLPSSICWLYSFHFVRRV